MKERIEGFSRRFVWWVYITVVAVVPRGSCARAVVGGGPMGVAAGKPLTLSSVQ